MISSANKVSVKQYLEDNIVVISASLAFIGISIPLYNAMTLDGNTNLTLQAFFFMVTYSTALYNLHLLNEVGSKKASLGLYLVWFFMTIAALLPAYFLSPLWNLYTHSSDIAQFLILLDIPITVLLCIGFIKLIRYLHKKSNSLLTFSSLIIKRLLRTDR